MGRHRAISNNKLPGSVLVGAAASGLAVTALSSAGTANATCASISGIGNGGGCTSTPTSFAVGLGPSTTASASGLFSGAIANGITNGPTDTTSAQTFGNLSFAYAGGQNTHTVTVGNLNLAVAQGNGLNNLTPVVAQAGASPLDIGNVAVNFGDAIGGPNVVASSGQANIAANLGGKAVNGTHSVTANGIANAAFNLGGQDNQIGAGALSPTGGFLTSAFNIGGSRNVALTDAGPLAVAGTLGVNDHNSAPGNPPAVNQLGPGINIKTPLNP
jgi:hypothetical protein